MNRVFRIAMVGLLLVLLFGAGAPVGAQNVRTLTIRDGKILIDDQEVPKKDLPVSLDLQGVEGTYTFVGDLRWMIQLGEVLYVFDHEGLREASDVYVVDSERPGRARYSAVLFAQAQALQQSTQELDALSLQFDQPEQQRANQVLQKVRFQVAQAAEVVEAVPRHEVLNYFSDVWRFDQGLYALIVREWRLEREAGSLAREIRNLLEGRLRQARIEQLREKLGEIFELKQQNRRRETEQLEQQLGALKERLQERHRQRDEIIDRYLKELIGV